MRNDFCRNSKLLDRLAVACTVTIRKETYYQKSLLLSLMDKYKYMKKTSLILSLLFVIIGFATSAQNATESTINIMKVSHPCVMATYNFSQDLLDETIKGRMESAKVPSPGKSKGFRVYRGVNLPEFGTEKMDIYMKTDGKKESSICYVAVSRGYDNFMTAKSDSATISAVENWLNTMVAYASANQWRHDIEDQESVTKKCDKAYNSSVVDGKYYQKDLEKLQRKIEDNKAEQAKLLRELESAKAKLEELKNSVNK